MKVIAMDINKTVSKKLNEIDEKVDTLEGFLEDIFERVVSLDTNVDIIKDLVSGKECEDKNV